MFQKAFREKVFPGLLRRQRQSVVPPAAKSKGSSPVHPAGAAPGRERAVGESGHCCQCCHHLLLVLAEYSHSPTQCLQSLTIWGTAFVLQAWTLPGVFTSCSTTSRCDSQQNAEEQGWQTDSSVSPHSPGGLASLLSVLQVPHLENQQYQ